VNGIRCAISLDATELDRSQFGDLYDVGRWVTRHGDGYPIFPGVIRIFGSHSEAKRELRNYWLDAYPDAKVVDETEIDG
jgi:hypothetical protein